MSRLDSRSRLNDGVATLRGRDRATNAARIIRSQLRLLAAMRDPIPERIIPEPQAPELYNIDDDPLEQKNIATDHPDRVSRMLTELETWFEEVESERLSIPSEW